MAVPWVGKPSLSIYISKNLHNYEKNPTMQGI